MTRDLILKLEKWVIWGTLIGGLILLNDLLPLIFLTFVLSYIGNTLTAWLGRRFPWRRANVVAVFLLFLFVLSSAAVLFVPRIFKEARNFAVGFIETEEKAALPGPDEPLVDRQTRKYFDGALVQLLGRSEFERWSRTESYGALLLKVETIVRNFIPKVIAAVRDFANASLFVLLQFFVAIILAFLIVFDFPALKASVHSLSEGRMSSIYAEVAPSLIAFGTILGRAFEAQTAIAIVNSVLTGIGFFALGIPSIALLVAIVFFCSYIPVVGVVLSTVPAALFALKTGGVTLVLWLVLMVLVVHAIEAYALNPLIYGHHMKMHPVAVIVILMIGEHLFGIWGLILGVPVAAFVRTYVMQWGVPAAPAAAVAVPVADESV